MRKILDVNSSDYPPDHYPNDLAVLSPFTTLICIHCSSPLVGLWETQCCNECLKTQIKIEEEEGWISQKQFNLHDFNVGSLYRVWWRGNRSSAFTRLVLSISKNDKDPWLILMNSHINSIVCWGSYSIQLSISPLVRGEQLGMQKIL